MPLCCPETDISPTKSFTCSDTNHTLSTTLSKAYLSAELDVYSQARAPYLTKASYAQFLSFLGLAVSLSSDPKFSRLLLKLDIVGFLTENGRILPEPAQVLLPALLEKLDPLDDAIYVTELHRDLKSAQIEATLSNVSNSNADKSVYCDLLELCR